MRFFVLVLMIVLLPLRAVAGDVMAVHMASSVAAIESGAARAHDMGAGASFDHQKQAVVPLKAVPDCHEHQASLSDAATSADTTSLAVPSNNDHCNSCAACQACHTLALSPTAPGGTAAFASPQLQQASAAVFTSADAALGQKPPIA